MTTIATVYLLNGVKLEGELIDMKKVYGFPAIQLSTPTGGEMDVFVHAIASMKQVIHNDEV